MYDDVESDFWKEIFVHLQHKNMVRAGAERLTLEQVQAAFDRFSTAFPQIPVEKEISSSSAKWEVPVTATIHLRLFIQNQIKASLLQRKGSDFVKIADAKFPYNPFPEISEFLSRRDSYERELHQKLEKNIVNQARQKLAFQFVKAALEKKFANSSLVWKLETSESGFILLLGNASDQKKIELSEENYYQQISELSIL
ncbi:MAG: hypothetical protein K5681_01640 [Treponema sp.]|nr:hypothetical protein [Treponema sp.]